MFYMDSSAEVPARKDASAYGLQPALVGMTIQFFLDVDVGS